MKNSKLAKMVLVGLVGVMLFVMATSVKAADYDDLAAAVSNSTSNTASLNSANTTSNTSNSTSNSTNNTLNTSSLRNTANTAAGKTNSYNNTNLPTTGIADSFPVIILIVIFGISTVYAYKKIKDYRSL